MRFPNLNKWIQRIQITKGFSPFSDKGFRIYSKADRVNLNSEIGYDFSRGCYVIWGNSWPHYFGLASQPHQDILVFGRGKDLKGYLKKYSASFPERPILKEELFWLEDCLQDIETKLERQDGWEGRSRINNCSISFPIKFNNEGILKQDKERITSIELFSLLTIVKDWNTTIESLLNL